VNDHFCGDSLASVWQTMRIFGCFGHLSGHATCPQARDRRLLGLIEALSVTPPRLPPSEQLQEEPESDATAEEAAPDAAGSSAGPGSEAAPQAAGDSAAQQLHPVLVTNALWSLGVMGGPVAFEAEMDALASVRVLAPLAWPSHERARCPAMVPSARQALGSC
jgi:hypothetical protein